MLTILLYYVVIPLDKCSLINLSVCMYVCMYVCMARSCCYTIGYQSLFKALKTKTVKKQHVLSRLRLMYACMFGSLLHDKIFAADH